MRGSRILVTGGTGFLGAGLVRGLCTRGAAVRVLDDNSRGRRERLGETAGGVEMIEADVRDREAVSRAVRGCEVVYHLACVNGTRYFYERPDLVLSVGVAGTLNVVEACRQEGVRRLIFASSSEVYQQPESVPTGENEPARIPDVLNPRYSYAGVKLIGELMVFHMLGQGSTEAIVFRPHNIYGPDMGFEHVVPEFVLRMAALKETVNGQAVDFPIQGDGSATRSFCYIEDAVDGMIRIGESGRDRNIYHLGVQDEIDIGGLARQLAGVMGLEIRLRPGPAPAGQTRRRCPDVSKLRGLGYRPRWQLAEGLARTAQWYTEWIGRNPQRWAEMRARLVAADG